MESPSATNLSQQLQNSLANTAHYLPDINNIGQSGDAHDLFYYIDFLVYLVDQSYPFIPCPSGCNHCCTQSGLPRTSALEWHLIYDYFKALPAETQLRVIERNEQMHRPQYEQFLKEQARIENPKSDLPLPDFGCKECPFLVDERCSVYPVRPSICRGFGYFTWRPGGARDSQVFACQMAADTLLDELRVRNESHAALPAWNPISDKVYALNEQLSTGVMATLPLWLMLHTQQDRQLSELNLDPVMAKGT